MPLGFFRTQAQVILGLLVLAGLDQSRAGGPAWALWAVVAGAVMAYLSAVAWGLGLPRFGTAASVLVALVTAAWLGAARGRLPLGCGCSTPRAGFPPACCWATTLTAMLLGHHYLTAPAMSIDPLKRIVTFLAWALAGAVPARRLRTVGLPGRDHWPGRVGRKPSCRDVSGGPMGHGLRGDRDRDLHDMEDRARSGRPNRRQEFSISP